jgi:SulP family sulfate permease
MSQSTEILNGYLCLKILVLSTRPLKYRIFPFLQWVHELDRRTLRADLLAGVTGAIIVLPQGVAFAMIAGLPPIYGLYTAMITPIIAALFGSSYHLISGPTTAISIVVYASVSKYVPPDQVSEFVALTMVLTVLAGAIQLAMGLARLGTLVNFVSHTVVIGFTAGAAILIASSQVPHILGLELSGGHAFWETWLDIFRHLGLTNPYVLLVGGGSLLSAILIRKFLPKVPYMLAAMVIGSVVALLVGGEDKGIKLVGEMPARLPPFNMPELSYANIRMLAPDAFAVALLGLIEAVAIGRAIATHTRQRIDGNQEFIGQGLSNLVAGFFSCYAGSGSFTRSGVNFSAGAKTPLSAIFAALLLMLIVLFVAPLTAYLPLPAMGGIILLVAYNLIDFHHIKTILKSSRIETTVLLVTFFATLFLELEVAIYVGVFFSLVFYLQRTSKPNIAVLAPDPDDHRRRLTNLVRKPSLPQCPQLAILRIDGSLYYGAVDHVANTLGDLREDKGQHSILIVADGINFIDLAGAEWLAQEASNWRARGGDLYVSGLKRTAQDVLEHSGMKEKMGPANFFATKKEAIAGIFPRLRESQCAMCQSRIFEECASVPEKPVEEGASEYSP